VQPYPIGKVPYYFDRTLLAVYQDVFHGLFTATPLAVTPLFMFWYVVPVVSYLLHSVYCFIQELVGSEAQGSVSGASPDRLIGFEIAVVVG